MVKSFLWDEDEKAAIDRALGAPPKPDGKPDLLVVLEDNVARACAEHPGEPRRKVYALTPAITKRPARPGSISFAGSGLPPGLDPDTIPRYGSKRRKMSHVLTLDLVDTPELAARFGGARAISLFCPTPSRGGRYDELEIVRVAHDQAGTLPSFDEDILPLAVVGVEIPTATFTCRGGACDVLRRELFAGGGLVLGEPVWLHEAHNTDGFFLQICDGLVPGLNLGDAGDLYVYDEDGAVMQCH